MKTPRKRPGLSLLELLAAITILAILVAIVACRAAVWRSRQGGEKACLLGDERKH